MSLVDRENKSFNLTGGRLESTVKRSKTESDGSAAPKRFFSDTELVKKSTINYKGAVTTKEKLERQLEMLEGLIPIAEGLFRSKPSQSNAYALTNITNQMNEVLDKLDDKLDYEKLSNLILTAVVAPFFQDLVKSLGLLISEAEEKIGINSNDQAKKRINRAMKELYRKYGKMSEDKLGDLVEKLLITVKSNI